MAVFNAAQATPILRTETYNELRLATLKIEQGHYLVVRGGSTSWE